MWERRERGLAGSLGRRRLVCGRRGAACKAHGGEEGGTQGRGERGTGGGAFREHAQLAERVSRVGIAARRVAPRHEVVVHERCHQPAVPGKGHKHDEREQHDLSERGRAEDVAGLELDQRDQESRHPH